MSLGLTLRRLGPEDADILRQLTEAGSAFELYQPTSLPGSDPAPSGEFPPTFDLEQARLFLSNPQVLYWVAFAGNQPVGELHCLELPLIQGRELMLYEIGVHKDWRKQGVGRLLLAEMQAWMDTYAVTDVWVLADNSGAVQFYQACGFEPETEQPVYMTRFGSL